MLILTEHLPYNLVLWGGTTMQPKLDQQVLWVWKSDERVNQLWKIVGRHLLKYLFIKRQFSKAILGCCDHWINEMYEHYDLGNI